MGELSHVDSAKPAFGSADPWRESTNGLDVRASDWRSDLRRAILSRVVPRLVEENAAAADLAGQRCPPSISPEQVLGFTTLVLKGDVSAIVAGIDALRAGGIGVDAVLMELLTPVARRLGDLWATDEVSFIHVTAGIARLQSIVRYLGPDFVPARHESQPSRRILLAPALGEQHMLGLVMVAAFFRRAGWDVAFEPRMALEDMLALVQVERVEVIGLQVATERGKVSVRAQVDALRASSLARDVVILAGGPAFVDGLDEAAALGFDGFARDADEAVRLAESLCPRSEKAI